MRAFATVRSCRLHAYRPALLLLAGVVLLAAGLSTPPSARAATVTLASDTLAPEMLAMVNGERAAAGLPPLELASGPFDVANVRALDMASRGYFSHFDSEGIGAEQLLDSAGLVGTLLGENIARTTGLSSYSPEQVIGVLHDALMASEYHRENVLDPNFRWVGIGVAIVDGLYYVAQVFID